MENITKVVIEKGSNGEIQSFRQDDTFIEMGARQGIILTSQEFPDSRHDIGLAIVGLQGNVLRLQFDAFVEMLELEGGTEFTLERGNVGVVDPKNDIEEPITDGSCKYIMHRSFGNSGRYVGRIVEITSALPESNDVLVLLLAKKAQDQVS